MSIPTPVDVYVNAAKTGEKYRFRNGRTHYVYEINYTILGEKTRTCDTDGHPIMFLSNRGEFAFNENYGRIYLTVLMTLLKNIDARGRKPVLHLCRCLQDNSWFRETVYSLL